MILPPLMPDGAWFYDLGDGGPPLGPYYAPGPSPFGLPRTLAKPPPTPPVIKCASSTTSGS